MDCLVSVIVPVYNVEKYLDECIRSVQGQTYRNLQIILVDDGSTDTSPSLCDLAAQTDDRITVVHQPNGGLSNARNTGIRCAEGKYIYFLDSDDYIETDAIEVLVETAKKNEVDLCFFDAKTFVSREDDTKDIKQISYLRTKDYGSDTGTQMLQKLFASGEYKTSVPLLFIRRGFIQDNGLSFYDGILHEDNLFTFLAFFKAEKVIHLHKLLYNRRMHANSIMTTPVSARNLHGYYVCGRELAGHLETAHSADAHNVLITCISSMCVAVLNIYGKLDSAQKKLAKEEFTATKRFLKKHKYFHDKKLFLSINFKFLSKIYHAFKKIFTH